MLIVSRVPSHLLDSTMYEVNAYQKIISKHWHEWLLQRAVILPLEPRAFFGIWSDRIRL